VPADSWSELVAVLKGIRCQSVFRGMPDANWVIKSSLERYVADGARRWESEKSITASFKARSQDYIESGRDPATDVDWWALMQHHGAPTRLVDFTRSPYVAAYFACEPPEPQSDRAVWALSLEDSYAGLGDAAATEATLGLSYNLLKADLARSDLKDLRSLLGANLAQDLIFKSRRSQPGLVPFEPARSYGRLAVQQGLFVAPLDVGSPFMENARHILLTKVVLPFSMRAEALDDLRMMNITEASLFPGLDGFARSLRTLA
jgi:hypothetical protein